ncbi:hypothetical protein [Desulforamulus hydrothermalis]|uniref:Uncharacterized protein n=1 Tax=Desulforamulus hydrothermalis Lam5 = DSM 18033 TaxID=1121428 RepID=K8DZL8_9FIRM|nr:hypothetical protein [Desulforamulus hydrothermalis]CCO08554.1 conserved hypothetical protein [Desulforamulus hydrothermalis Lam5 = DSM 18033]SHH02316.1 hypothetical protein SAMN02745177_01172 [Desulforamulus hydrothermalis Lam5 = DSM 18033]
MAKALLLLTFAYAMIIALELPRLLARRHRRELLAFGLLLLPAMLYGYGLVFDLPLPNPSDWLTAALKPLAMHMEQVFGTAK